ncbi:LysR family transcriptional regulator [Pseudomonas nicosulfuronedens]|uniref:LysR family transcriptional regulator n=1 Tax=Pseudomonas nicosulfuronedens TaxID=2571105 RepID=A0A5R9R7B4_9PSED|nr:LysR family transcriptional regulator [Pseudomonas nicosulfuronedens]MDH1010134.1 LysR family transcriptional regulator [Pseudomonas nicosulfuronedens]MDH1980150.1 LysR family transcriptional regulator [Pseudomonas nicosulfuronedens]MDH2025369.1 LysR family transcriptional regulator [Pseudomonas nicosulfuronedens]TLX78777.1 LysR family transcriptional regulator [Pseudomonas nicosulfuronedens]
MDRLEQMTCFVRAVELGSFSAAAEDLQLSSQLLGKQVKLLEQHLGLSLLNRTTRRQSLTDFGQAFYQRAKLILADMEAAENLAAVTRGTPSGRLRINAPVTFGIRTLSPRLLEYMVRYPQVSVDLTLSNELVDLVNDGYDVVFRIGELADSGLKAVPLTPYRLVLCAAPAYLARRPAIRTPEELSQHECLGFTFSDGRSSWTFDGPDGRIEVPITSRLTINQGDPLLAAAVAGLGVVLQPQELVGDALRNGTLVQLLPQYPVPTSPMHMLYAPDRRLTPKLRSFLDFAIAAFGRPA